MTRILDILLSLFGFILLSPVFLVVWIIVHFEVKQAIFPQTRVGLNRKPFTLYKFRTMDIDTDSMASHLIPSTKITKSGKFLRRAKLDELPQLWNILVGDMSLVGPRPCLETQTTLLKLRDSHNIFDVLPGLTGLAQISKVDMSDPELLTKLDFEMVKNFSTITYLKYIVLTIFGRGIGDAVK